MTPTLTGRTILGDFCHAPTQAGAVVLRRALIELDATGVITNVLIRDDPGHGRALKSAEDAGQLVRVPGFLLPGFVDTHVHAPQYPQLGHALDRPLETWLLDHTFPLEARYADIAFAEHVYDRLVRDLLAHGTTTCVYFATLHGPATRLLARTCVAHGQRAVIGQVAMDHPDLCPPDYRDENAGSALTGTRSLIAAISALSGNAGAHPLVRPAITPRFVPACTDRLLRGLGDLAQATGCHVQTHCSESDWAHGHVLERFGRSDATVLEDFGLLTRHTVLAHGNFLSGDDMDRVAGRGAGVAHCPHSNAYFADSVFPLRAALAKGMRVGLGTDISGGPSASMFDAARMAVVSSRLLQSGVDPTRPRIERGRPGSQIDIGVAFHLATAGGADMLDLPVGRFAPGQLFDAMRLDPDAPGGTIRLWGGETDAELVASLLYTASRANVAAVWTAGSPAG